MQGMPFVLTRPDTSGESAAVSLIKTFIDDGGFSQGDRLPAEREMIALLGVKRTALRKALDVLERQGVIWRHVGKGTFVGGDTEPALLGSLAHVSQSITPVKMMRARQSIEAAIAREAAVNASHSAVRKIKDAMQQARDARSWAEYERHDDHFHAAVAAASDNLLLIALFDQLNHVRRTVAVSSVIRETERPPENHTSFAEHEKICSAIEARDSKAAHDAMWHHISSVSARLFEQV